MINLISAIEELNFGEAVLVLLVGMGIILVVLSVLVGLLYIIRFVVRAIEKPKTAKQVTPVAGGDEQKFVEDEETIAAITAAITCILNEEAKEGEIVAPFKIKKIKHIR